MLRNLLPFVAVSVAIIPLSTASAAEPLHVRIDKIIDAAQIGPQGAIASDAQFLRRAYLDLAGVIPTSDEARTFLNDPAPDKRVKLIDRLLSSPQYVRHQTDAFNLMLMERRSNAAEWLEYLRSSVEQNKPWNEMAAEILGTDGSDPKKRGPINYYLARSVEPNLMTREIGRTFFGMDVQCAQCHDHPRVNDYLQRDYYGIYAFVNRTFQFKVGKNPVVLAEKAEGDVSFKSVFTSEAGMTRPRLPGGKQIDEPTFKKGDEYKVKPTKNVRPIPKHSRREVLSKLVRTGENAAFRRNIVNRLWAQVMGRGIVHPPDFLHRENPPSHPELLDLLAIEFAAMKFDVKAFLRELMLTKAYQRSVALPENLVERASATAPRLAQFKSAEKVWLAKQSELEKSISTADAEREAIEGALATNAQELKKANAAITATKKTQPTLATALTAAQKQLVVKEAAAKPLVATVAKAEQSLQQQPEDKKLTANLANMKKQLQQRNAEVAVLKKAVDQKTAAVKSAADKLAAAQQTVTKLTADQAKAQKQIDDVKQRVRDLKDRNADIGLALAVIQRRAATVEALLAFAKLQGSPGGDSKALEEAYDELTKHWSEQFVIGTLEHLSPEQMAWSFMQATGFLERQRTTSAAAIDKKLKLKPDEKDPAKLAAREKEIEEAVHNKLKGNLGVFVQLFGVGAGQPQNEFFATADQALFFANGGTVRSWLAPGGTNLTARLLKLDDPKALAEELYLSVLTRRPTAEEIGDVKQYVEARPKQKSAAIQEMAWALLTSSEFRFHH